MTFPNLSPAPLQLRSGEPQASSLSIYIYIYIYTRKPCVSPLALSECHLVTPSKLHAFSPSSEMMKMFPECVPAGQVFGKKCEGED